MVGMTQTHIQIACERIGQSVLAKALKVTRSNVNQWTSGIRKVPADYCPTIEWMLKGEITVEQLRGDVPWRRIPQRKWPNGKPVVDYPVLG